MDKETREMMEFMEKCQKKLGKTFMEAFDMWLETASLRGSTILERGTWEDEISTPLANVKPEMSLLPLKTPSELLTVEQVCEYLGISRASLYRHDIPGKCKVGGQVRYLKVDVDDWLKAQRAG